MKKLNAVEKLKEFKSETNLKWSVIATELGTNKHTLSRWVNNKNSPSKIYEKTIFKFINKNS